MARGSVAISAVFNSGDGPPLEDTTPLVQDPGDVEMGSWVVRPAAPPQRVLGEMTVTWFEEGHFTVTFTPLGRITDALVDRSLPVLYRRINEARVASRRRAA